jgi:predicted dithiol-disulfide oxidoreductase (DUF899 family)
MATSKERDKEHGKGHLAMNTPPIVSQQEWEAARQQLLVKDNRGDEAMGTTWSYLDLTPLGRQETWEDSPEGYPQTPPYKWWNWHDNYDAEASPDPMWVEVSDSGEAAFRKRDAEAKPS